jgi:hypothetical protein
VSLSTKAGLRFSESGKTGRPRDFFAIIKEYPKIHPKGVATRRIKGYPLNQQLARANKKPQPVLVTLTGAKTTSFR